MIGACRAPSRWASHAPPIPLATSALRQNRVLAALDAAELACVAAELVLVELASGEVVCEAGQIQPVAYFPTTALMSLRCATAGGASAEMAVIGNEGVAGISVLLGNDPSPHRLVVQSGGHAFGISSAELRQQFARGGHLQQLILRYTHTLITQTAQTAVCNRHHSLERQVCRRLLSSLDRLGGNAVTITHEGLAHLLGVRREGVSVAASRLQRDGLIDCRRGCITVLDRAALETRACECYGVVRRQIDALRPAVAEVHPVPQRRTVFAQNGARWCENSARPSL
jgi:CRP-like cAMP-binding protein